MAWDDTKKTSDSLPASEWNDHVVDQKNHSSRHVDGGGDALNVFDLVGTLNGTGLELNNDTLQLISEIADSSGRQYVAYEGGMTFFESGLTNEEIHRFHVPSGDNFEVHEVALLSKGGGATSTDAQMEVYEESSGTTLHTADLNTSTYVGSASSDGATIVVEITTSAEVDCSPMVRGVIK